MDGTSERRPSPSSCGAVAKCRRNWSPAEDDGGGDPSATAASCTGKSCQSCTAGAIADCVAVLCCPCAVVNFLALALVKLPCAVGRRFLYGRRRRIRSRRRSEERGRAAADQEGIMSTSDMVLGGGGELLNDRFSAGELKAEDVWLEMYDEVGHLGFGRVSFNDQGQLWEFT